MQNSRIFLRNNAPKMPEKEKKHKKAQKKRRITIGSSNGNGRP